MQTTGTEVILRRLVEAGVEAVFLVPGSQIDPLSKRLAGATELRTIIANHELAAGFMADGYARASLRPGVCLGIGACGAANMLPAAAAAAADDSALLFLTGNIVTSRNSFGAFQDAGPEGSDDSAVFRHFARYSAVPESVEALRSAIDRAINLMSRPFRTPVHLSIPYDVQNGEVSSEAALGSLPSDPGELDANADACAEQIADALASARRPCLLVGPRFTSTDAHQLIRQFAETYCIPVATTLSAKGILPETHPLSLGNFGFGGSRRAQEAILRGEPDAIVLLGADFNERDSLSWDRRINPRGRRIMRVDSKRVGSSGIEFEKHSTNDSVATVRQWLNDSGTRFGPLLKSAPARSSWAKTLALTPRTYQMPVQSPEGRLPLDLVVQTLQENVPEDTILVVDAGLHRIFAGHYWEARQPGTFYSACATVPMGWAICAAAGIQIARPNQPVVVLTGDGCMRAQGMELCTMVRYQLPIVTIVCNNGGYGSVYRRMSDLPIGDELTRFPQTDWVGFAESLGARAKRVDNETSLRDSLTTIFDDRVNGTNKTRGPFMLEVATQFHQQIPHPELVCSSLSSSTLLNGRT